MHTWVNGIINLFHRDPWHLIFLFGCHGNQYRTKRVILHWNLNIEIFFQLYSSLNSNVEINRFKAACMVHSCYVSKMCDILFLSYNKVVYVTQLCDFASFGCHGNQEWTKRCIFYFRYVSKYVAFRSWGMVIYPGGPLVFQAGYHPRKRTFKTSPKHIFQVWK